MFAGKHRPGADPGLRAAADRAFEVPLALILEGQARGDVVAGDPENVGMVAFAAAHGIAALANNQMLGDFDLDGIVENAVERLVLGLRPALDALGDPLGERERRQVRVHARDRRHHRGVRDDEAVDAEHPRRRRRPRARSRRCRRGGRSRARWPRTCSRAPTSRPGAALARRRRQQPRPASPRSARRPRRARRRRAVGEEAVVDRERRSRVGRRGGGPSRASAASSRTRRR